MANKTYTAQEMREEAELLKDSGLCLKISDMLRQAADFMEREEKREKKYEYGVKFIGGTILAISEAKSSDAYKFLKRVRREVGEWEEVRDGE